MARGTGSSMVSCLVKNVNVDCAILDYTAQLYCTERLASYPGSDYAGAEKRAWYILHAHALNFQRILWICIFSVFLRV